MQITKSHNKGRTFVLGMKAAEGDKLQKWSEDKGRWWIKFRQAGGGTGMECEAMVEEIKKVMGG